MIHKLRSPLLILPFLAAFYVSPAWAERRSVMVVDSSTSGRLVRVNIGSLAGLKPGEPVLFSATNKKIAAGRVVRTDDGSAIVAVLEKYGAESPMLETDYELVFGEYFDGAANLPEYVADREEEIDNPANERFFEKDENNSSPDLDDDAYTPEVTLRPKFPEGRTFNPHNLTIGLALYRNRALPTADVSDSDETGYTTYTGYTFRYAYTFRTHYWLRIKAPALISVEAGFGIYNFEHTMPDQRVAQVRVTPLSFNVRYLVEVSKLFRLYPYLGYQHNIVGAVDGDLESLENIRGGRLMGGAGAQLMMSESMDARLEGGSDGIMGGVVVKF
jgi:hypothetical protein